MALNNAIGTALVTSHPASKPKIATFDLNSGVQQDLTNGSMAFAIDQQQYLQGYLPLVFLDLYKRKNGQTWAAAPPSPAGRWSLTKSNICKVSAAIAAGRTDAERSRTGATRSRTLIDNARSPGGSHSRPVARPRNPETMSATSPPIATPPSASEQDERLVPISRVTRTLRRPELGSLLAAVFVFMMFAITRLSSNHLWLKQTGLAAWTQQAAFFGSSRSPWGC